MVLPNDRVHLFRVDQAPVAILLLIDLDFHRLEGMRAKVVGDLEDTAAMPPVRSSLKRPDNGPRSGSSSCPDYRQCSDPR